MSLLLARIEVTVATCSLLFLRKIRILLEVSFPEYHASPKRFLPTSLRRLFATVCPSSSEMRAVILHGEENLRPFLLFCHHRGYLILMPFPFCDFAIFHMASPSSPAGGASPAKVYVISSYDSVGEAIFVEPLSSRLPEGTKIDQLNTSEHILAEDVVVTVVGGTLGGVISTTAGADVPRNAETPAIVGTGALNEGVKRVSTESMVVPTVEASSTADGAKSHFVGAAL